MRFPIPRRAIRVGLSWLVLTTFLLSVPGVAVGAKLIHQSGTHGAYVVTDTSAKPGARCRYDGTAGTWYLNSMHVRAPIIYGTSRHARSVGYRQFLQRRTAHGWKTVQRGPLISGAATKKTAAALPGSTLVRDLAKAPNWPRYRAALKLIWWDAYANVKGRVILAMKHHRRSFDGSVGRTCHGRVPIT